ncbi:MAG: glycosyltransferase family 2 protein [Planctomycetota bacterium]
MGKDTQTRAVAGQSSCDENGGNCRDISCIVPVHSRFEVLDRCLDALYGQSMEDEQYEVILVANGVAERNRPEMEEVVGRWQGAFGERLQTVELPQASIPLARNAGVRAAAGRLILQMNEDTILTRPALEQHVRTHEVLSHNPRCVLVGGRRFPESHRDSLFNNLYERVPLYTPLHKPGPIVQAPAKWFVTCNLSCPRESYERFGLFDPTYDWGSDTELGLRWARQADLNLYVSTRIVSYHLHELSFDAWKRNCIRRARYSVRMDCGRWPEELPPAGRADVERQLGALRLDTDAFESEMRRIETEFTGPDEFGPVDFMGRRFGDFTEFCRSARPAIMQFKNYLQLTEVRRLTHGKAEGAALAADATAPGGATHHG